jgi:auxin-responsive protein IAA
MGRSSSSCSSSIDSSSHPSLSSASSLPHLKRDLSTDLRLGLSISSSIPRYYIYIFYNPSLSELLAPTISQIIISSFFFFGIREQTLDYPPVMSVAAEGNECNDHTTFFVKVYMEGIPIGRKLDLLAHDGYDDLIRTLDHMFTTNILC